MTCLAFSLGQDEEQLTQTLEVEEDEIREKRPQKDDKLRQSVRQRKSKGKPLPGGGYEKDLEEMRSEREKETSPSISLKRKRLSAHEMVAEKQAVLSEAFTEWMKDNAKEIKKRKKDVQEEEEEFSIDSVREIKKKLQKTMRKDRDETVTLTYVLDLMEFLNVGHLNFDKIRNFDGKIKGHTLAGEERLAFIATLGNTSEETLAMLEQRFSRTWWRLPSNFVDAQTNGEEHGHKRKRYAVDSSTVCKLAKDPVGGTDVILLGVGVDLHDGGAFMSPKLKYVINKS
jgi:hypothetical protein